MVDQKHIDLIIEIVDRGYQTMKMSGYYLNELDMMMDIESTNQNCPLRLQELLDADDLNFYHDLTGIHKNLNRKTKKLENCFVPRYAK